MIQKKKICLLGAYGVGKSSLVKRFVNSMFDEKYHTTIGVKVDEKMVDLEGAQMKLMVWDIAGAEDTFSVPTHYVRGSDGYILVIDGTRLQSLDRALEMVHQIDAELGVLPRVVALNKCDLVDQWALGDSEISKLDSLGATLFRSSAKSGEGVEEAFNALASQLAG